MSEKVAKLRHFLMTYNFNQLPKPYRLLAMGFSGQLLRMIESEQDKEKLEEGINEFLDSLKIFANIIDSGHLPPDLEQRLDNKNLTVVKNLLAKMDGKTKVSFLKFLKDVEEALKWSLTGRMGL